MAGVSSRDTRIAIMSRSMNSPRWIPASNRPATRSMRFSSVVTSSTMSGNPARTVPAPAQAPSSRRWEHTKSRTRPAGRSRRPESRSSAPRMSPSAGRSRARNSSPASVRATLRVVRASRRTPTRSSSARMAWLKAEGDTPSCFAARVKLRSSATEERRQRVEIVASHL